MNQPAGDTGQTLRERLDYELGVIKRMGLEGIFAEITGEYHKSVLMSGGTYARKLKNAFSLGTSVILPERKDKVLEMPEGHGGPHQRDERIDIEGFFTAVRILLHYVIESDKIING